MMNPKALLTSLHPWSQAPSMRTGSCGTPVMSHRWVTCLRLPGCMPSPQGQGADEKSTEQEQSFQCGSHKSHVGWIFSHGETQDHHSPSSPRRDSAGLTWRTLHPQHRPSSCSRKSLFKTCHHQINRKVKTHQYLDFSNGHLIIQSRRGLSRSQNPLFNLLGLQEFRMKHYTVSSVA